MQNRTDTRDIELLEDVLMSVWLHGSWRELTRQMTTEQRERFADAVEASSSRLDGTEPLVVNRWWADRALPPSPRTPGRTFSDYRDVQVSGGRTPVSPWVRSLVRWSLAWVAIVAAIVAGLFIQDLWDDPELTPVYLRNPPAAPVAEETCCDA